MKNTVYKIPSDAATIVVSTYELLRDIRLMSARLSVKPEDILTLAEGTKDGTHEAGDVALTRAEAILILLSSQFDEEGMQTLGAEWIGNSICAVRGELGIVRNLLNLK